MELKEKIARELYYISSFAADDNWGSLPQKEINDWFIKAEAILPIIEEQVGKISKAWKEDSEYQLVLAKNRVKTEVKAERERTVKALNDYVNSDISSERCAELIGINHFEFLSLLHRREAEI